MTPRSPSREEPAGDVPGRVRDVIARGLDADPRTREPMGALVAWTELGRGLCGNLDRKGADVGLLGRTIDRWCRERGAAEVDLARWAYRVDEGGRPSAAELATTLAGLQQEIERVVGPVAEDAGDDGGRAAFLAVVKGWFPAGLAILRSFPRGQKASEAELLGALRAWCGRYLPRDPDGPAELGVRVVR